MKRVLATALVLLTIGIATRAQEETQDEEPLDLSIFDCEEHLAVKEEGEETYVVLTVWAHGYDSALRGVDETAAPITWEMTRKSQRPCGRTKTSGANASQGRSPLTNS